MIYLTRFWENITTHTEHFLPLSQVEKRRRLTPSPPELPEPGLKRDGHELMTYDVLKRRRIGNDQVPILKVPKDSTVANVQELSMRKDDLGSLLPFRSQWSGSLGSSTVQLLLSGACGLKQVTLDSHGIMFEVYDHGFMCIGCNIAFFAFIFQHRIGSYVVCRCTCEFITFITHAFC